MFSSHPPPAVPAANPDAAKLIAAIRDQTQGTPPHMVYVLDIVSVRFGGYFTAEVRAELERFRYLQMLTLNDCGIVSLENFPTLPALIRLDMVFNSIPGEHIIHLAGSRHLQTLMLGANKVEKVSDLAPLKSLRQLLQLDLLNNPVVNEPGYRAQVFSMFPSLSILDTLDKVGKDAYNNSTMMEAVARIPDNLFDKSVPPPPVPLVLAPVHSKEKKKLSHALARTGSLDSITHKAKKSDPAPKKTDRSKGGKAKMSAIGSGKSRSSRAGLLFPVGRVRRMLKGNTVGMRIGLGSSIYLAAVLEYLSAEILEIAGKDAQDNRKKRITPSSIRSALKGDLQFKQLLENVTIGMLGE